jgi:hypothetical protein
MGHTFPPDTIWHELAGWSPLCFQCFNQQPLHLAELWLVHFITSAEISVQRVFDRMK